MPPARVALVGAGSIAGDYVEGLRQTLGFEVVAVCARTSQGAIAFGARHEVPAAGFDEILHDADINYVLNLTPADAHEDITRACLEHGKSVYSEKPLASSLTAADALITLADKHHLLLACAPATFMWPPLTTARRLIGEGALGAVAGAQATLVYPGPEIFHANPAHLYGASAGPLKDMGVYQMTALVILLGPVVAVAAMSSQAWAERVVRVGPNAGSRFPVGAATHVAALLRHAGGAISSVTVSFDAINAVRPQLDIFGHRGGINIADFHRPDAVVKLQHTGCAPQPVRPDPPASPALAAIGPTQAWAAHNSGQPIETSALQARHVLAVLLAIEAAAARDTFVTLE